MGNAKTKAVAKPKELLGKNAPHVAVVKKTPMFQLQFLFTDIDFKNQRLRELKATVVAQAKAHPGWDSYARDKAAVDEKLKTIKKAVAVECKSELDDIKELTTELETVAEKFKREAIPLLVAGKQVTLNGDGTGIKYVAELDVKVRALPAEDEELDQDEKTKALPAGKAKRKKKK